MRTTELLRGLPILLGCALLASCGGGGGDGGSGPLNITSTTADDGVIGVAYNNTVSAFGGKGAKSFSITSGALPGGLSLSASGVISGTPAGPVGTSNFTVQVSDSANTPETDTQALSIDIVEPLEIESVSLPDTSVGDDYAGSIVASGGTPPLIFSVSEGELPAGVTIDGTGAVTGGVGPTAITGTFTITVTDSSSPQLTTTQEATVRVDLEITTTALAVALGGVEYADTVAVQGGLPPYQWSLVAGTLPAGLTGPDSDDGSISGTPVANCAISTTNLTVHVVDDDTPAQDANQSGIELTVEPATLDITTSALANAQLDTAYSQPVVASGGVPPYSFAITGGSLPNQLSLNATTGRITGTPDILETQAFDVTVTDSCAETALQALSITVAASLGRNDSISTATVLPGDGTYSASISPSGHPNSTYQPDEDFYAITTTAASTITIDVNAEVNGSPIDAVVEVLNAAGVQLQSCGTSPFDDPCFNDDEPGGGTLDSFLQLRVTGPT
ncbi:MAG TPA: Ig domain-containing protein, partial [Steroidobacteraceae bacterium]|nr:Ig domain-containing protein [Steroidobacteraceae bacterium]